MSMVRMCDGCGLIFPEGQEGSATGTVSVAVRGTDGQVRQQQRVQDMCPLCAAGGSAVPKLAIEPKRTMIG